MAGPCRDAPSATLTIPAGWSTAILADACVRNAVAPRVAPSGLQSLVPGPVAGRVRPVRHFGSVDVFLEALERSLPGDVLVIDNGGRLDEGSVGDLIAIEAQAAGMAGIVCWGAVRDRRELRQVGLPIFAYGTMPTGPTAPRQQEDDALAWARVGSVMASEQDTVFADEDGALFVANTVLPVVMETAAAIAAAERAQAEKVRSGICLREQFQFDEYLRLRARAPGYSLREHLARHQQAIEA